MVSRSLARCASWQELNLARLRPGRELFTQDSFSVRSFFLCAPQSAKNGFLFLRDVQRHAQEAQARLARSTLPLRRLHLFVSPSPIFERL